MLKGLLLSSASIAVCFATPAWAQNAGDQASGSQKAAAPSADDIVVTGIRRSLESAQSIKRDSDQIVDSVVAEDIGKLPDVTAAESVARISGIQVDRAEGAASGVRVRGLPDFATTYNGREIFTGKGRSVALQDFPAGSIGSINVYKSSTAELVEPGIAGLIDVRSKRPLDFKKDQFFGSITGVHWYQSQDLGIDANFLISKRWSTSIGEIGVLVNGSYTQIDYIDSSRINNLTISNRKNLAAYPAGIRYPSTVNTDYDAADRWRPSATFALQWKPSGNLEFYLDGLFQGYRSNGEDRNLQSTVGDAVPLSNIEFFPGTNLVKSFDATGGAAFPTGSQHVIDGNTDTYQIGGGFNWRHGPLKISGDLAYTDSKFETRDFAFNFSLLGAPKKHYDFDTNAGVGGGTVVLSNYDLFNPGNYRMVGLAETGSISAGQETQARLDAEYQLDGSFLDKLQLGVRYSNRDAQAYNYAQNHTAPPGTLFTQLPLDYENVAPGFRNDQAQSQRVFVVPTRDSLAANMDYLRGLTSQSTPTYGDPIYLSNEQSYSGYAQLRYNLQLGVPIDGLFGVRAVHTDDVINGFNRESMPNPAGGPPIVSLTPVTKQNSFTDFLPNISSRIHLADRFQVRLAYTMTRTRANFDDLNPTLTIAVPPTNCIEDPALPGNGPGSPDCVRTATEGNADLKPTRSKNFDLSFEYYPTRTTSATVGLFRRNVDGFISDFTVEVQDPEYGRLRITQPDNGGRGRIQGVEVAVSTLLSAPWLPNWLHNFGVQGNYTYLDHSSELPEEYAAALPGQQPITGVSSHLYNVVGFYETKGLSVRLAYNHRSSYVLNYQDLPNGFISPVIQDGSGDLSLSASVDPTKNVSFTFSVTNLLGAAAQNHRAFDAAGDTYIYQTRFLESVYRVGMRFHF